MLLNQGSWTSSLQPLYVVLIVDEFPQYLYQIPLQYIIHLGPDISLLSLCNEYHLLYYYNFHSCCQNLEWGHENWSKNLDIIKVCLPSFCGQVDFACTISHHNDELHSCTSQPLFLLTRMRSSIIWEWPPRGDGTMSQWYKESYADIILELGLHVKPANTYIIHAWCLICMCSNLECQVFCRIRKNHGNWVQNENRRKQHFCNSK